MTYLRNRRREHDYFIQLANSLHEFINTGPLDDVNIVVVALNLNRDREIGLMKDLRQGQRRHVIFW